MNSALRFTRLFALAPMAASAAALVTPRVAAAEVPPTEEAMVTGAGDPLDVVVVEELAADGVTVLAARTFDQNGTQVRVNSDGTVTPVAVPRDSGTGGDSTAHGCRKVTVKNTSRTSWLDDVAYRYNTWTSWCWDRADKAVSEVHTGQFFEDVDGVHQYRGLKVHDEHLYAWRSGYNKSGHWHERQAEWTNCVIKYGCILTQYPRNVLRVHADGTYSWATNL